MKKKAKVRIDGAGVSVDVGDHIEDNWTVYKTLDGEVRTTAGFNMSRRLTPKRLRRIAAELLRLADEVDPPKPSDAALVRAYTMAYTPAECGPAQPLLTSEQRENLLSNLAVRDNVGGAEGTWLH